MGIAKKLESFLSLKKAERPAKKGDERITIQSVSSDSLFIGDAQKINSLYQLMAEEPLQFLVGKRGRGETQELVAEAVKGTVLDGAKVGESGLDSVPLSRNLKKIPKQKFASAISLAYKRLFSLLYFEIAAISGFEDAKSAFADVQESVKKKYGPHLSFAMSKALPEETIPENSRMSMLVQCYIDLANDFSSRLCGKKVDVSQKDIAGSLTPPLKEVLINPDGTFNFSRIEGSLNRMQEDKVRRLSASFAALIAVLFKFGSAGIGQKGAKKMIDLAYNSVYSKYENSPVSNCLHSIMPDGTLPEKKELETLVSCYEDFANEILSELLSKGVEASAESLGPGMTLALEGAELGPHYRLDFSKVSPNLEKMKGDRKRHLAASFANLFSLLYNLGVSELGSENTKKILSSAHAAIKEKYGYGSISLRILTAVPKGVLEPEKLELLTKGELEKVTRERMKVDELKDQFMNIAAHELKTPLIPIIGYVDILLKDKKIPPKEKRQLQIILQAAQREKKLVDDILDISKLESGAMKFAMSHISLNPILASIVKELQSGAAAKKIRLELRTTKESPIVFADQKRLAQVLDNLIGNAIKFTDHGTIHVAAERKKGQAIVSVTDTGIGIPKSAMPKLFTKFYQVDSAANRKAGGTGLGLAITKEIVEAHGGKIWIKSRLGRGSAFSFSIPEGKSGRRSR